MKKLIIHVGPAKCGSSTIQNLCQAIANQRKEEVRFFFLDPNTIEGLSRKPIDESCLSEISKLFESHQGGDQTLIISHEFLFSCPLSVQQITKSARSFDYDVTIVGFCRRQSDWLRSAYSQWWFRMAENISRTGKIMEANQISSFYFSGLEQQLIASILSDFEQPAGMTYDMYWRQSSNQLRGGMIYDMHWRQSYAQLRSLTAELGAEVKCSVLPKRGSSESLATLFLEMANLKHHKDLELAEQSFSDYPPVVNPSFQSDVVELIAQAVSLGFPMPSFHHDNEAISHLSTLFAQSKIKSTHSTDFVEKLYSYIDSSFYEDNRCFARLCSGLQIA